MSNRAEVDQRYFNVFDSIDEIVAKKIDNKQVIALGYTSNLDILCDMDIDTLNKLIEQNLVGKTINDIKLASVISNVEELLHTIIHFCSNGIGGEVDIEDVNLFYNYFSFSNGMGGTAVQAAMALSKISCPTLVHLTDDSKEVCEILQSPYIYAVDENDNLIHTDSKEQTNEQEVHVIVQFRKGDVIVLGGEDITIPTSNRLIITKTTVNKVLPLNEHYFAYVENNAANVTSNVLSSFNVILDENILRQRLEYIKEHLAIYKKNNPEGIIFFEDAHYHDENIKSIVLKELYCHVDVFSLNEEELAYLMSLCKFKVHSTGIQYYIDALRLVRKSFEIKKATILHTKDYSLYVGEDINRDIESGLMFGNMIATAKATFGNYGTKEQIKSVLDYPLSDVGVEYYNNIKQNNYEDTVILVPSKYMDKPKYTIGLGDCFIGGLQLCF